MAAIASATSTSIRVKPLLARSAGSEWIMDNGYPPRQPIDSHPPDLTAAIDGHAPAGAAAIGIEADATLVGGIHQVPAGEQAQTHILRQGALRLAAPAITLRRQV